MSLRRRCIIGIGWVYRCEWGLWQYKKFVLCMRGYVVVDLNYLILSC